MYARVITFQAQAGKLEEAIAIYRDSIMPVRVDFHWSRSCTKRNKSIDRGVRRAVGYQCIVGAKKPDHVRGRGRLEMRTV